jgi:hypothetical protein
MMSKLKVWKKKYASESGDDLYFRLLDGRNGVSVAIVDKNGDKVPGGNVIVLDNTNKIVVICDNLTPRAPFKTDLSGCALTYTEPHLMTLIHMQDIR